MIVPPPLKSGDTVGIVAPGRKLAPAQLEPAIKVLQSWGLRPILANNIFSSSHSYLAGSDPERSEDFQQMLNNPEVKAIFCARGGYGSTRIIEKLDFSSLHQQPKWIAGFSDITAFHLHLHNLGMASIHGTMPIFFGREEARTSVDSLRNILFGGACEVVFASQPHNRWGTAMGEVIGGNLSLINDSLNTSSEPSTNGKILVIEEIDEYYYKVDRMLTQLRRAGKLQNLAGLLIGHMTDIRNSDLAFGEILEEIVLRSVEGYSYPVAFGFPSGHENPNLAWIESLPATIIVSDDGVTLSYSNAYLMNE